MGRLIQMKLGMDFSRECGEGDLGIFFSVILRAGLSLDYVSSRVD